MKALMGCPAGFNEGLVGHAGSSTEYKFYMKLLPEEKRAIFDYFFPYYNVSYFEITDEQKREINDKYNALRERFVREITN